MKKYYEAYEDRYKSAHESGVSWAGENPTPIVLQTLEKYGVNKTAKILEIGCGEGRDARAVLACGYNLAATDISHEAISYCKKKMPEYADCFSILDCIGGERDEKYDFVYAVAVLHMLVLDEDRRKFYDFIKKHLSKDGLALVCSMGDGEVEHKSDISTAFEIQERIHPSGVMKVAGTSCRMVSFATFDKEIDNAGLHIVEAGITESMPDFNSLMYAVLTA